VQRKIERKTGRKLVGQDKGSLTEQQTKGTGTTMVQIRIHKTKQQNAESRSHRPPPLLSRDCLPAAQLWNY